MAVGSLFRHRFLSCACALHHVAATGKTSDNVVARSRSCSPPTGCGAGWGLDWFAIIITLNSKPVTGKVASGNGFPTMNCSDMLLELLILITNYIGLRILRLSQVALIARPGRL